MKYLLVIEEAGGNLSAWFPEVPGCVAVGDSVEEVRESAREALAFHLDDQGVIPAWRPLQELLQSGDVESTGEEVLAWVPYEHGKAFTSA
jgi:predicted RNase H-like HicB family nuclease